MYSMGNNKRRIRYVRKFNDFMCVCMLFYRGDCCGDVCFAAGEKGVGLSGGREAAWLGSDGNNAFGSADWRGNRAERSDQGV